MKSIRLFSITVLYTILFIIVGIKAFGQDVVVDLNNCFGNGNVESIRAHLSNNVDLSFDQQKSIYSKSQAIVLLKQFIEREPATNYKIIKTSNLKESTRIFFISSYKSSTKSYLIYLSLRKEQEQFKITEISIERQ